MLRPIFLACSASLFVAGCGAPESGSATTTASEPHRGSTSRALDSSETPRAGSEQAEEPAPVVTAVFEVAGGRLADVPPFTQIAGGSNGVCGLNDEGVWCWRFTPGTELFRPPSQRLAGAYVGVAVHRAIYTLSESGELAHHDHARSHVLAQLQHASEFKQMVAKTWGPNRAREVVCVELDITHCVQFSVDGVGNHAILQTVLPPSTRRWTLGPQITVQTANGDIRWMRRWDDEWVSRAAWPLISLEGRSDPDASENTLDPGPLRDGPATLTPTPDGDFRVTTRAGVFNCGRVGTSRYRPDEFACTASVPMIDGALLSAGEMTVVPSDTEGLQNLVRRDGTTLVRDARQLAFSGNNIYALAPDGSVHFLSR